MMGLRAIGSGLIGYTVQLRLSPIPATTLVAIVLASVQLVLSRHFLLDDAMIHMRYAELLLRTGFPTSDGISRGFGDSSPAFLFMNAAGYWLSDSMYVSKVLSVVGFAAIVLGLAWMSCRATHPALRVVYLVYLLIVVSPFGIRWLSDGMETSWAVVLAVVLAACLSDARSDGRAAVVASAVPAFLCVVLRIELFALVCAVGCGQLIRSRYRSAVAALIGGLLALAIVHLEFGAFYSDAAIAKVRFGYATSEFVTLLALVAAGAGLFGVGLAIAWIFSVCVGATLAARGDRQVLALLLGTLSLVPVGMVIFVRGQAVEGIRPLLPFLAFSLACGTTLFAQSDAAKSSGQAWLNKARRLKWPAPLAVAVYAGLVVVDWTAFNHIVQTQARTLSAMHNKGLSALSRATGVAWEVGFISYFTKAHICDLQGLIDGPAFARLSIEERVRACAPSADFAFVDQQRFDLLADERSFAGWLVCDRFAFAHRSAAYFVYLLLAPALATPAFCASNARRLDADGTTDLEKYF